ncbi:hypothetical protein [Geodermatophilus chilensis]|uniref:hypothetical protein n=1 Tax=Geodermatophilus chilensis TaxID=2035835 RepID=UPI000C25E75D|nr:hypothetical protein [Geodermatophilus chilensis]
MTALLIYRNATPEVMAWAEDYKARAQQVAAARWGWMADLYDAHGVPDDTPDSDARIRGAFTRGCAFSGLSWPDDIPLPDGWFRPVKTPQLVRPRANTKAGKTALAEMARFDRPDARRELRKKFGMPEHVFAGSGLYTSGVRMEDDGVWVTWASRDVAHEKEMANVGDHGWERIPLARYIDRFGEDDL